MHPPQPTDRVVQVRAGASTLGLIVVTLSVLLVAGVVTARALRDGVADTGRWPALAGAVGVVVVVGLVIGWLVRGRGGPIWDLDRRLVVSRSGTIPFADIHRVIVCTGAKGYYGILLFGNEGLLRRLSIPVGHGRRQPPEVWLAVRELLASPHAPSLEGYGTPTISAREFTTKSPLSAARGQRAVAILDAQIAWVAHGGNPRHRDAPIEQFRVSRYAGP